MNRTAPAGTGRAVSGFRGRTWRGRRAALLSCPRQHGWWRAQIRAHRVQSQSREPLWPLDVACSSSAKPVPTFAQHAQKWSWSAIRPCLKLTKV